MALSEEEVFNIYCKSDSVIDTHATNLHRFAQAIEAEVRAQDTALIRQLVEALEQLMSHNTGCQAEAIFNSAITAARARLKEIAP